MTQWSERLHVPEVFPFLNYQYFNDTWLTTSDPLHLSKIIKESDHEFTTNFPRDPQGLYLKILA